MLVAYTLASVHSKYGWNKRPWVESSAAASAAYDGRLNTGLDAFQERPDKNAEDSSRSAAATASHNGGLYAGPDAFQGPPTAEYDKRTSNIIYIGHPRQTSHSCDNYVPPSRPLHDTSLLRDESATWLDGFPDFTGKR